MKIMSNLETYKKTMMTLNASEDTLSEVMKMTKSKRKTPTKTLLVAAVVSVLTFALVGTALAYGDVIGQFIFGDSNAVQVDSIGDSNAVQVDSSANTSMQEDDFHGYYQEHRMEVNIYATSVDIFIVDWTDWDFILGLFNKVSLMLHLSDGTTVQPKLGGAEGGADGVSLSYEMEFIDPGDIERVTFRDVDIGWNVTRVTLRDIDSGG